MSTDFSSDGSGNDFASSDGREVTVLGVAGSKDSVLRASFAVVFIFPSGATGGDILSASAV